MLKYAKKFLVSKKIAILNEFRILKFIVMKKSTSNALLGFLAGAAAGAVIGILYAPEKGSQTRKNIKKKSRR
jgi:branched-subunit amino acid transport protein AzlD